MGMKMTSIPRRWQQVCDRNGRVWRYEKMHYEYFWVSGREFMGERELLRMFGPVTQA